MEQNLKIVVEVSIAAAAAMSEDRAGEWPTA
jgi:hypothetical protein